MNQKAAVFLERGFGGFHSKSIPFSVEWLSENNQKIIQPVVPSMSLLHPTGHVRIVCEDEDKIMIVDETGSMAMGLDKSQAP